MCFAFTMCSLALLGVVYCISTRQLVHNVGMIGVLSVKLFLATGYIVVYLYLLECYPTTCRATGPRLLMVFGRFGAATVPFLYDGAHLVGVAQIWFFVVMSGVILGAAVATCLLPFETKDAELVADIRGGEQGEGARERAAVYTPEVPTRIPRRLSRSHSPARMLTPRRRQWSGPPLLGGGRSARAEPGAEAAAWPPPRDLSAESATTLNSGRLVFFSARGEASPRAMSADPPVGARLPTV